VLTLLNQQQALHGECLLAGDSSRSNAAPVYVCLLYGMFESTISAINFACEQEDGCSLLCIGFVSLETSIAASCSLSSLCV
jgi:hypothetical protein